MRKAQSSIELLCILAVALVILMAVFMVSTDQIANLQKSKNIQMAKDSVRNLAESANQVYFQGEGSKKQIFINIPGTISHERSFIGKPIDSNASPRMINLRVQGSDIFEITDVDVYGTIPLTVGGHWIWVESEGNRVRIGSGIMDIDKSGIYERMNRNGQKYEEITVRNIVNETITVNISLNWRHSGVSVSVDKTQLDLIEDESSSIKLTISSSTSAIGIYSGSITFIGYYGNVSDEIELPITVEVWAPTPAPTVAPTPTPEPTVSPSPSPTPEPTCGEIVTLSRCKYNTGCSSEEYKIRWNVTIVDTNGNNTNAENVKLNITKSSVNVAENVNMGVISTGYYEYNYTTCESKDDYLGGHVIASTESCDDISTTREENEINVFPDC